MAQVVSKNVFEALTDGELVEHSKEGDEAAFREIVSRHETMVFNVAYRIVGNRQDAEDAAQDAFVNLALNLSRFEGRSSLKTWIYRVTANAALMNVRSRKKHRHTVSLDGSLAGDHGAERDWLSRVAAPAADADRDVLAAEAQIVIQHAIAGLPENFRTVLVLADIEELSNLEIADVLELSLAAVKSRLHRARLVMRRELAPYFDRSTGAAPTTVRRRTPAPVLAAAC